MSQDARSRLLERLNEYRDLIAFVLLFLGGLGWIYAQFARKEKVKVQNCILSAIIDSTSDKTTVAIRQNEIEGIDLELKVLDTKSPLSQEEDSRHKILQDKRRAAEMALNSARDALIERYNNLLKGTCGGMGE